jgi:integrase
MARARHGRLTDTFIESLSPQEGGRERIVRDGAIPGFLIRVGLRKRTFELRIEKPPKITVPVGHWPDLCAVEARRKAEDLWDKHRKGEALDDRPPRDDETIATTWPRFKKRLEDDGRSERTIDGYSDVVKRLSDRVKQRPLRELAGDPTIMEREVERIREVLRNKKRGGQAMATAAARFVSTLFNFACKRYPSLRTLGDPCSAVSTVDPERDDLPALAEADMKEWWAKIQQLKREHHREAHLFCLLSGLRRNSLVELEWKHLDLKRRCILVPKPKGGRKKEFDLILSRPMIRCLWRARKVGRRLYPENAKRWVFAGSSNGHVRGDGLPKDGVMANHSLRRAYATAATNAGVDEDTVGKLLNHGGRSVTSRYIKTSYLGRMLAAAQEDISAHIVKAMGSPRGLT